MSSSPVESIPQKLVGKATAVLDPSTYLEGVHIHTAHQDHQPEDHLDQNGCHQLWEINYYYYLKNHNNLPSTTKEGRQHYWTVDSVKGCEGTYIHSEYRSDAAAAEQANKLCSIHLSFYYYEANVRPCRHAFRGVIICCE